MRRPPSSSHLQARFDTPTVLETTVTTSLEGRRDRLTIVHASDLQLRDRALPSDSLGLAIHWSAQLAKLGPLWAGQS